MKSKDLKLDKHPQALRPSLFIVVLAAGIRPTADGKSFANIEFYQHRLVAYTKEEAIQGTVKKLQTEMPTLYYRGKKMGEWHVTHIDGIEANEMERLFKERGDLERTLEKEADSIKHNALLQEILKTQNLNLFHQAIRDGRINHYQRLYLHNELTKDSPDKPPELLKSNYLNL